MKITREDIQNKLLDWQKGVVSAKQVYDWANALCEDDAVEFADQEGEDSISSEALFFLEMLDMNLSTSEDVPIYLRLLATPKGAFAAGMSEFDKKFKARVLDRRRHQLKSDPLYAKFL